MNLIRYGEKFFDELEIHTLTRREVSAKAELNQISSAMSSDLSMTVVRGVKDGRMGISIVDTDDEERIKKGIENASRLALLNERDENWHGFPERQKYESREYSEQEDKDADYFVNILTLSLKDISEKRRDAMVVGAETGGVYVRSRIENSNGVDVEQSDMLSYFVLVMMGRYGERVTPSIFDMDVQKTSELNTESVIESCLKKLENARNVVRAEQTEAKIIFEPFALAEILQFALYPSFNGERKVKGTSKLADYEGERVMSDMVSIEDNPHHEMSISRIIADDEGVATRPVSIVDRGVFRGFLWNHYWAEVAGVESTGNGVRSFRTGAVGIGAHNMIFREGNRKMEEMIRDIDRGYMVSSFQGAHSSNPDTGSISAVANPAFVIEDGEIKGSTVFMVSGNVYDLLNNVVAVENRLHPVYMMSRGLYPGVMFENVKIAPVSR